MSQPYGFINLLKCPGMTSHDAVARVRRILKTRAVGHAGTLDPAASGVLPLAVGKATRLLEFLVAASKVYIGELTFGVATDTLDQEGRIVEQASEMPRLTEQQIRRGMQGMVGRQLQRPPAYSAIKHQGKPLYEYARSGEELEVSAREIEIHGFDLLRLDGRRCLFRVHCSKGTYVRALVRDLAERLGTIATLTFLLREQVGSFGLAESYTLEELAANPADHILPATLAVASLPHIELDLEQARRFLHGQRLRLPVLAWTAAPAVAVFAADQLIGIGRYHHRLLAPSKVLAQWEELQPR
ncbi:MAG: tRNA pseudouridine(55) synthase TruB [Bacillota bacterium]|jgi:tRNA pseudouridine55 synthase